MYEEDCEYNEKLKEVHYKVDNLKKRIMKINELLDNVQDKLVKINKYINEDVAK
jgi:hypothetical protein